MPMFSNSVTGNENAIEGVSVNGRGLVGKSETNYGARAHSNKSAGIRGSSDEGNGVEGWATLSEGVVGISKTGAGVAGKSEKATGVRGESTDGRGLEGTSLNDYGIRGHSHKSAGIRGSSDESPGVEGWATGAVGVVGISATGNGVWGQTEGAGVGVLGTSKGGVGVYAKGGRLAGFFEGDLEVTGDIRLVNADCAEDFDVVGLEKVEAGSVMVLGASGALGESQQPYDRRVAGVISGAADYKPGIIMDKQAVGANRQPVALMGKVFCKVDARFGAIEIGDLLTTSPTPAHAMKAGDPARAFGAVIGKALRSLPSGQGLIPILVSLQ